MTGLADLPPLREVLAAEGLLARKSFGQHFLLDLNVTRKIARLAAPLAGSVVIEVGPGPVEKDPRFLPLLHDLAAAAPGRLTLIEADALTVDETALIAAHAPGLVPRVISNLPYNVGTPLLIKWLTGPLRPVAMHLMFQKEVALRIAAPVGSDAYGRLSVIAQAVAETRIAMTLPARAFTPPPKVDSAVAELVLRTQDRPSAARLAALETVTAHAFGQRRKMLRSSLKALGGGALCEAAGIDADARAETIPVDGFLALAKVVEA